METDRHQSQALIVAIAATQTGNRQLFVCFTGIGAKRVPQLEDTDFPTRRIDGGAYIINIPAVLSGPNREHGQYPRSYDIHHGTATTT